MLIVYHKMPSMVEVLSFYEVFYKKLIAECGGLLTLTSFIYFNQQYEKYFNMSKEKYYNKTVLDLEYLAPEDRERYQNEDLALIRDGRVAHYETTFELGHGETSYALYWSSGFVSDVWHRRGLIGEIVDISTEKRLKNQIEKSVEELEVANQKIESLMKHDFLTGLYNRRIMNDFLFKDNNKNGNINASFLLADLDLFKRVNDTYGHLVGDDILVQIAKIMQASCRKDDYVIRYGGEEFLIVFFNTRVENVALIAERIRKSAENELLLPDGKTVTVSIGISQMKLGESMERCISRVDSALYEAKLAGRNRVVIK